MHKIDGYIMRTVGGAMLLVMLVVLSLDVIFAFIGELEDTERGYQTPAGALVCGADAAEANLRLPAAGRLHGLSGGAGHHGQFLRADGDPGRGVSLRRIVWSAMKPALIVVLLGVGIGEYVAPVTERIAQSEKAVALGAGRNVASAQGVWHREGNTFMHLNAVQPNGVLNGITLFRYDDERQLQSASFARRAIYQGDYWLLQNVTTTRIGEERTERETSSQLRWETGLSPDVLSVLIVKPENLSMSGLYTYATYLGEQGLSASRYWLAFWKKALMPLGTAVMVLVAISFVFGPLRSVTMGFRVFTGLLVGLLFKYMQDLLGPMSMVYGFNPVLAVLAPIVINGLVGAMLMRRAG